MAISYGTDGVDKLSNWACTGEATVFWGDKEDYDEPRDVPFSDIIIDDPTEELEEMAEEALEQYEAPT